MKTLVTRQSSFVTALALAAAAAGFRAAPVAEFRDGDLSFGLSAGTTFVSGLVYTIAKNLRKNAWLDDSRIAFTLFQVGELSIREIARDTGASENLVKVRIHRAKQRLQILLADLREP